MQTLRYILITCLVSILVFGTATYTACKKDKCKEGFCKNGGSCLDGKCTCPIQYTGTYCETDLCKGVNCQNGGQCVTGTCNCLNGYTGEHCEIINKYIGSYLAKDTCNNGADIKNYGIDISMQPTGNPTIEIKGMNAIPSKVYASLANPDNSFTFQSTTYEGYYFQGSGVFENGVIHIGYTVTYGSSTYSCVGTWVKQ